jgi:hypothetical protein
MTNEEFIKNIADEYELPVEQVALIWSVVDWTEWASSEDIAHLVKEFIQEKMCT